MTDSNPFIGLTYQQAIDSLVDRYGDKEALLFEGRRYSFADIRHESNKAAARLATLGLKPGDKVALWMPNRPEFMWYWFGAAKSGLVAVFLNTRLRRDEFVYQIAQSDSAIVIVPGRPAFRDFLGELVEACPELANRQASKLDSATFPRLKAVVTCDAPPRPLPGVLDWSQPQDLPVPMTATDANAPALICYSSGTTALPKGAMLTSCVWRKSYDSGARLELTPADCLYLCVPLFGVLGSLNGMLSFWSHGARVVLDERFNVDICLRALEQERCTALFMLPPMVDVMAAHPHFKTAKLNLRIGSVLSSDPAALHRAVETLGVRGVITGYGLTESTAPVTRTRWDDPIETRFQNQGKPLPDCHIRVVDPDTGLDMPRGEPGEIWIGGYSVMLGYYNKPEETKKTITEDGWLRSGDLGILNQDGSVKFLRRVKDGYKHKGFNVSTLEVERVAADHPDIGQIAVVGIPDPRYGEIGVAFVIPRAGVRFERQSLLPFLAPRLASFKLPAYVFVVEAFPVTGGTEKIQKFKLRELAIERLKPSSTESYSAVTDPVAIHERA